MLNAEGRTLGVSVKPHLEKPFQAVVRFSNMVDVSLRRGSVCRGTVDANITPGPCERQLRWASFKGSGEGTGCWLRIHH